MPTIDSRALSQTRTVDLAHYAAIGAVHPSTEILDAIEQHVALVNRYETAVADIEDRETDLRVADAADAAALKRAVEHDEPLPKLDLTKQRAALDRAHQVASAFSGPMVRSAAAVFQRIDRERDSLVDQAETFVHEKVRAVQEADAAVNRAKALLTEATALRSWLQNLDLRHGIAPSGHLRGVGKAQSRRGFQPVASEQD